MDAAELARRAAAAREFEHEIEGRTWRLRIPTRVEETLIQLKYAADGPGAIAFATVYGAVVGWKKVTIGDALPGDEAAKDEAPWSPETVAAVLGDHQGWAEALYLELDRRRKEYRARFEADRKNSASASTGS